MKVTILKEVNPIMHFKDLKKKSTFRSGDVDAIVNGVEMKLLLRCSTGGVTAADVSSKTLSYDEKKLLSSWWYGCNFADIDYTIGVEFNVEQEIDKAVSEERE